MAYERLFEPHSKVLGHKALRVETRPVLSVSELHSLLSSLNGALELCL